MVADADDHDVVDRGCIADLGNRFIDVCALYLHTVLESGPLNQGGNFVGFWVYLQFKK